MSFVPAYVALAAFLVLLGFLALAARPGSRLNWAFWAVLVLEGVGDVVFQVFRETGDPDLRARIERLGTWYLFLEHLLMVVLLHLLFRGEGRGRWRAAGLAVGLGAGGALFLAFALPGYPGGEAPLELGRSGSERLQTLLESVYFLAVQAAAVVLAGRASVSPTASAMERKRASLVGLAFLFLVGHTAMGVVLTSAAAIGSRVPGSDLLVAALQGAVHAAALALALHALPRLASAWEGRRRRWFLALAAAAPAWSAWTALATLAGGLGGVAWLASGFGSDWVRLPVVVAFAGTLAVALVRFGLAGLGDRMRARVAAASHATMVLAVAALPAGAVVAVTGQGLLGLGAAAVLGLGAVALSPAPLRAASRRVALALLVRPGDPGVVGERAREYLAALEAEAGPAAEAPPASHPRLRDLRGELGLDDADHALLAAVAEERRRLRQATGPALLGRYQVERELGRGAFGTALLALDVATGERVVVKRFHAPWAEERALAEARALAQVRHPRIVPLRSVERVGDELILVMAYVEGGGLDALLLREGPLPPERAAALAADLLDALEALHAAGLAHGDVKPANLLLDAGGRAVLADLGSARAVARPDPETTLTSAPVLGSFATVAPEVLRGSRAGPAADLYAAGAVLYHMLTGGNYVDFSGLGTAEAVDAILRAPPRLPHPRIPAAFEGLLARALAKDPGDRYPDAAAMRAALAAAAGPPR